jgi:putative membrane protein
LPVTVGVVLALAATGLAFAGFGMTGHMAAHMLAVAVAAPVLAFSLPLPSGVGRRSVAGRSLAAKRDGQAASPLLWAMVEFFVVWAWHLPALRDLADMNPAVALAEQALFLGAGVMLWRAALARPAEGVAALLLTSMHMTLLGALIGLATRPLYAMMAMHPAPGLDALADQQLGGVVMLLVGGASYCLGGLWMLGTVLKERAA